MEASRVSLGRFNLGVDGIKLVSRSTAQFTAPAAQVLGGAQFNSSFTNFSMTEGCTSKFPPRPIDRPAACSIPSTCTIQMCIPVACIPQACLAPGVTQADLASFHTLRDVPRKDLISPEQAEYNVLKVYFDGTPAASFFGGTPGATPFNYLQIYAVDFQYAEAHAHAPEQLVRDRRRERLHLGAGSAQPGETEDLGDRRAGLVAAEVIPMHFHRNPKPHDGAASVARLSESGPRIRGRSRSSIHSFRSCKFV